MDYKDLLIETQRKLIEIQEEKINALLERLRSLNLTDSYNKPVSDGITDCTEAIQKIINLDDFKTDEQKKKIVLNILKEIDVYSCELGQCMERLIPKVSYVNKNRNCEVFGDNFDNLCLNLTEIVSIEKEGD